MTKVKHFLVALNFYCNSVFLVSNFTWLICFSIVSFLYPRWMSLAVSFFSIPSKCCLVELVLRYLFASPFAMANLVAGGWYEEACT